MDFPEVADLEVLELRKKIKELEAKLAESERLLQENGISKRTTISPEEQICIDQIGKLKELSDKGIPFQTEDVKNLEVLVKTLQLARGKSLPVEDKKSKKEEKQDLAKLLQIAAKKD
jgi:hypothetical protein